MSLLSRMALAGLTAAAPVPALADQFCDALRAFERAPLVDGADGRPQPRHVELFWRGPWDIYNIGYECRHRGDPASRLLCRTLTANMPQEFRTALPFRIMRCYGYRFPAFVTNRWYAWSAEIELAEGRNGRLRLDVSLDQAGNLRDAIRLALIPAGYNVEANPLPTLREPVPAPQD